MVLRKKLLVIGLPLVLMVTAAAYHLLSQTLNFIPRTDEERAVIVEEAAAQNETAFHRPTRQPRVMNAKNELNNVYFGDLHVHSSLSADAYLFGNRRDLDDSYRFAKGESTQLATGEVVELTIPLDFTAVTDHAEGFGRVTACQNPSTPDIDEACSLINRPNMLSFLELRASVERRPLVENLSFFSDDKSIERQYHADTWRLIKQAADRHNDPGVFTAFAGYEYSPAMIDRGKHHRNVIFRSSDTPNYAISAYDADSEIDLWRQLSETCTGDCEFITIPHNPNKSWGLAFASETIDGVPYNRADWALREKFEPLVEMFQIKGNSECLLGAGSTDEECSFEQFFPACESDQTTLCIHPTSMVRDGLKKGLMLEQSIGFNPLKFGLMASTDTHNSNPGDTEEWDFRGSNTYLGSPAKNRLESTLRNPKITNPGGLAAVWAPENTRDALFNSMRRREVYATSGTRITLRLFAGAELPEDIAQTGDLAAGYEMGVPMGGTLLASEKAPRFFAWAAQDPNHAPLAKLQIVKGWLEGGKTLEQVYDVACDNTAPEGGCLKTQTPVNLADCSWPSNEGAPELRASWVDPDYDQHQNAFYYARAIQISTCRWTTYDSLRLGLEPPEDVPATVREMAWSSPVWISASKR